MSDIVVSTENNIITIRMNRVEKKNAITAVMYADMADALEAAEANTAIRSVIICGVGGVFTAGNDLADFLQNPAVGEEAPVSRFMMAMVKASFPIVAAVDGFAIGIGVTMLLHCDHVIATERAHLQMPFTNLALVPEFGSSMILPARLGHTVAAELILEGRALNGTEAHHFGIATTVVEPDALEAAARAKAEIYLSKPPASIRASKRLLRGDVAQLREYVIKESTAFAEALNSDECKEALSAFMEKRKPDWSKFG